jgi:hypothetical protein
MSGENEFRTATVTQFCENSHASQLMSSAFGAATTTLTRSSAHCRVLFATRPLIDILEHIPHIMNELLSSNLWETGPVSIAVSMSQSLQVLLEVSSFPRRRASEGVR